MRNFLTASSMCLSSSSVFHEAVGLGLRDASHDLGIGRPSLSSKSRMNSMVL